ncbi:hypothetical protein [Novosphingobium sp. P6W]|uniref:hypothetical protein n=1 Tax=Novosphingobium sp. P6W TaxID=1609758 RepID=UPI000697465B|nr:hypothetical protein [Novosphingobium sp. P6W]
MWRGLASAHRGSPIASSGTRATLGGGRTGQIKGRLKNIRAWATQSYNHICIELAEKPQAYAPIYMRTEEGEALLEDFANGSFTAGHLDTEA